MENAPVVIPATFNGKPCGEIALGRDGLYTTAKCRCSRVSEAVLRAYVRCGEETVCLGVVAPEADALCLHRRIPSSRLDPARAEAAYLSDGEESPWSPWQGTLEGCALSGMARIQEGRQIVAVPYDPAQPLPCLRLYAAMTPLWLGGKLYLTL